MSRRSAADPSRTRSTVRVLVAGLALTVEGCGVARTDAADGPAPGPAGAPGGSAPVPQPEPTAPVVQMPRNPPPPRLRTWDEVESTHPKGATNPPSPVLEVRADGQRCWKAWRPGMIAPSDEERRLGGRVIPVDGRGSGTAIVCPEPAASAVLQAARTPVR